MKKILGGVAAACMTFALVACGGSSSASTSGSDGVSGEYTGTAKGMGGDVTVTLTLKDSKITDVKAEGDKETDGIGTKALEQLPDEIKEKNSIGVDGVSGATVTSDAIKDAAKAALESAGLNASDYE